MSTFHEFSPLILTASQNHMLGSVNRLILLMRKQRPKEVKQLASGYTTVKLWGLEIDQVYLTSSSHVWMWELDYKESWAPKNWWIWTVGLEKTLESPLDCKEIKPVHPKGNQSWIFIGRTDAKAETPILWPPDAKNWLIGKTLMLGKIEGRRRRGQQKMRWLDGITDLMDMSLCKLQSRWWTGKPGVLQSMGSQGVRHDWLNWTELNLSSESKFWSTTPWRQDIPSLMKGVLSYTQLCLIRS